eukprot:1244971-Rhodomonas_salina.2
MRERVLLSEGRALAACCLLLAACCLLRMSGVSRRLFLRGQMGCAVPDTVAGASREKKRPSLTNPRIQVLLYVLCVAPGPTARP